MADIAIPRNAHSPATVAQESVDEGRWESEGGGSMKNLLKAEKSAEAALSDMAKGSSGAASSTAPSSSDVEKPASLKPSEYDINVHPSVIEGAPGSVDDSKYGHSGDTKEAEKTTEADAKPPVARRKKSISEKLSETWHDIKAKAGDLVHRKNSKDSRDSKD